MANAVAMVVALALIVASAATSAGGASSQRCDAGQLTAVRAPTIISGTAPTPACCSSLRAQRECFCQYARGNPTYRGYINSDEARRALASCGIAAPRC